MYNCEKVLNGVNVPKECFLFKREKSATLLAIHISGARLKSVSKYNTMRVCFTMFRVMQTQADTLVLHYLVSNKLNNLVNTEFNNTGHEHEDK